MTIAKRIYVIKLPLTLDEYRRGFRYALSKFTTDEVSFIKMDRQRQIDSVTTETVKVLNLSKRMPYMVRKVIPAAACLVEEFSTNIDTLQFKKGDDKYTHVHKETKLKQIGKIYRSEEIVDELNTQVVAESAVAVEPADMKQSLGDESGIIGHYTKTTYKNRHFDEKTFKMRIDTKVCAENSFKFTGVDAEVEELDFRTFLKNKVVKVGENDYSGDYEKKYGAVYVFKYVEIELNSMVLGWIAKEILKVLRNNIVEIQQDIVKYRDKWIEMSEEELEKMEKDVVEKFMKNV
ncbi:hypothetical protein ECANGB1_942 [Enterospora canceri]|uniref:Phosphatidylinositol transfer protein N-terminal domain-containing protein n=1 Tax=Enterospora canceri TaxID=1081671 RepID=A0A1Y1S792_9MICR|nr:hypothetical protein ECANGB1_942 [Enterospora canceri]